MNALMRSKKRETVSALFPAHSIWVDVNSVKGVEDGLLCTMKEFQEAVYAIQNKEAPEHMFRYVNRCSIIRFIQSLPEGRYFACCWKGASVALISKGKAYA